jgi:hypothetical protein
VKLGIDNSYGADSPKVIRPRAQKLEPDTRFRASLSPAAHETWRPVQLFDWQDAT